METFDSLRPTNFQLMSQIQGNSVNYSDFLQFIISVRCYKTTATPLVTSTNIPVSKMTRRLEGYFGMYAGGRCGGVWSVELLFVASVQYRV